MAGMDDRDEMEACPIKSVFRPLVALAHPGRHNRPYINGRASSAAKVNGAGIYYALFPVSA